MAEPSTMQQAHRDRAPEALAPDDDDVVVIEDDLLEPSEATEATDSEAQAPTLPDPGPMPEADPRPTTPSAPSGAAATGGSGTLLRRSVAISEDRPPALDEDDPWETVAADRFLRAGLTPSVARAEGVDVLVLGRRNALFLWILLGQCAGVMVLMGLICSAIIHMPAKGIPSSGQIAIYRKTTAEKDQVLHFAEMVAARMETWSHWNAKANPKRVTPFLDPGIRGIYENGFKDLARDADVYQERHLFEPVDLQYKGVKQETKHVVLVFYKAYVGRGSDERDFKLDRVARRVKVLEIAEGPISIENVYGMFVIKHFDLTEDQWVDSMHDNPWDRAEGVSEDVLKTRERQREHDKAHPKPPAQAAP